MKTSSLIVALSVALSVMAAPQGNNRQGSNVAQNNNRFGNGGNNQNQNGGNNGNTAASNGQTAGKNGNAGNTGNNASKGTAATGGNTASNGTAAAGAATGGSNANNSTAAAGAATGGNTANNTAATGGNNANNSTATGTTDAQASLTLDPKVIATGFADNGQDVPADGQVASLTSTNNFINFCLTVPNLPITNGKQITTGSCNPAPMGVLPSTDNMPSSKFVSPKNGDTLKENTPFTITMAIQNMQTGFFVNAAANYFAAPQQLNSAGQIQGHSHVVVETLSALDQTTTTDPKKFAFFKGLNAAASGGQLTADVTAGLPAGFYKLSSINSASNHQPVLVPIAQHGSLDDAVYFTITADGNAAAGAAGNSTAAAAGAANSTAAASAGGAVVKGNAAPIASAAPVAGNTNKNTNKNQNTGAKNQGKNAGNRRSFLRRRL